MTGICNFRYYALLLLITVSCSRPQTHELVNSATNTRDSRFADGAIDSSALMAYSATGTSGSLALPDSIVAFAKTLIGTPYKFGCSAPETGFDCSGFITYVFNHFNIKVPRSSVDFTNEGTTVPTDKALPGDLILFTGTNSHVRTVGHIGIIVSNENGNISFIQSTSGKEFSVTITPLDDYYMTRFVKVIRILK